MSLQKRYILLMSFLVIAFFVAAGLLASRFQEEYIRQEVIEEAELLAASLQWTAGEYLAQENEGRLREMMQQLGKNRALEDLAFYYDGNMYAPLDPPPGQRPFGLDLASRALESEEGRAVSGTLRQGTFVVAVVLESEALESEALKSPAVFLFRPNVGPMAQSVSQAMYRLVAGGVLLFLLIALLSYHFFSRWVLRPMWEILRRLNWLEEGEYAAPSPAPHSSREFSMLFQALEEMRRRIERSSRRIELRGALDTVMKENARDLMASGVEDIDETVEGVLRRTMRFLRADAAGIYFLQGSNWLFATHYAFDVTPPLRSNTAASPLFNLRREEYPWMVQRIERRKMVVVRKMQQIPQVHLDDRQGLQRSGVGACLLIPFFSAQLNQGALGFWCFDRDHTWDVVSAPGLQRIGEFTEMALMRTRAQQNLMESEKRYRQMAENLREALFLFDEGLEHFLYISPVMEQIWDEPVDQLYASPQRWLEKVHQMDKPAVREYLRRMQEGEEPEPVEFRLVLGLGGERWIRLQIHPVRREEVPEARWTGIAENITQRKRMELQLAWAREQEYQIGERIQRTLLLDDPPEQIEGFSIAADTLPSRSIDGDFFHFLDFKENILDIITGDVMGKGIGAALVGAGVKSGMLQSAVDSFIHAPAGEVPSATQIICAAEEGLGANLIDLDTFVTMNYVRTTREPPMIEFIDCGNTPILHYRSSDDEVWRVKGNNMPLGFVEEQEYHSYRIPVLAGDTLLFFSDGISEAADSQGNVFGVDRLADFLRLHADKEPNELIRLLKQELVFFVGSNQFEDDVTMVFMQVEENEWQYEVRDLPAERETIGLLREWIEQYFSVSGTGGETFTGEGAMKEAREELTLAAVEAFTNILRHNTLPRGTRIRGELGMIPSEAAYVRMDHSGTLFDWHRERPVGDVEQFQEHSYGLELMRRTTDSVHYNSTEERAGVWLVKFLGDR